MISSEDFDRVRIFTKIVKGRCTSAAPKKENPGALRDREIHSVSAKPTDDKKISGETACPAPAGQAVYA